MAGRIPEDIIEKVRDEVSIEEVVGHFVPLQRKSGSFWGLCPFHSEKTPSFHVHPDRQIYYCFGCHRGGNVFSFLMEREGMRFPEAVEWCAARIGLDLSRFTAEADGEAGDTRGPLLAANEWAAKWFAEQLQGPGGAEARSYLQERGLRPETIEHFQLGLAPRDGGEFVQAAKAAGLGQETLLQAALLGRKDGRAPFAYFRSRLIFPIRGAAQKTHGFGGRILGPGEPKYLNSPETPVYHKRKVLYALPEARSHVVRAKAGILVEGYMDAIALHQAGWTNTVATCGTAFAPEQAKVLRRMCDVLYLLFDGDKAGRAAAYKSADVALTAGLDVRVVDLPAGKDPADLVVEGEVEALQHAIDNAPGLVESMRRQVEEHGGGRPLVERALHRIRDLLTRIPDPIRTELIRQEAAEAFRVRPSLLAARGQAPARGQHEPSPAPAMEQGALAELERRLLCLGMARRSARQLLVERLAPEDFSHSRMRVVLEALAQVDEGVDTVSDQDLPGLPEDCRPLVARLQAELPDPSLDVKAELVAHLEHLNLKRQQARAADERDRLAQEFESDPDRALERLQQKQRSKSSRPTGQP